MRTCRGVLADVGQMRRPPPASPVRADGVRQRRCDDHDRTARRWLHIADTGSAHLPEPKLQDGAVSQTSASPCRTPSSPNERSETGQSRRRIRMRIRCRLATKLVDPRQRAEGFWKRVDRDGRSCLASNHLTLVGTKNRQHGATSTRDNKDISMRRVGAFKPRPLSLLHTALLTSDEVPLLSVPCRPRLVSFAVAMIWRRGAARPTTTITQLQAASTREAISKSRSVALSCSYPLVLPPDLTSAQPPAQQVTHV